ncbi:MAG: spike base protein, RCAP_Rcc01079 family [Candidatus Anammoxibacter sp.]
MTKFIGMLAVIVLVCFMASQAQAAQTKDAKRTLDAYAPFEDLIQITASDATTYDPPLRGCIVEVAGTLAINPIKSTANVTITVIAGQMIPVIMTQVLSTGTTATVVCGR